MGIKSNDWHLLCKPTESEEEMNKHEMNALMRRIDNIVNQTRDDGQSEYARDYDNVFANFERVASFIGVSREKVLLTYMIKHIDGLCAYADGHKSQREDVRGRLTDIQVYCRLFWGMVEDNLENKSNKGDRYEERI